MCMTILSWLKQAGEPADEILQFSGGTFRDLLCERNVQGKRSYFTVLSRSPQACCPLIRALLTIAASRCTGRMFLLIAVCLHLLLASAVADEGRDDAQLFRLEHPRVVLDGVPVPLLRVVALTPAGEVDTAFSESIEATGLRLLQQREQVPLPPFEEGVLELRTDRANQVRIMLDASVIEFHTSAGEGNAFAVRRLSGWASVLPPLLAIVLAIWWKEVVSALFLAALSGMLLLNPNLIAGLVAAVDPLVLDQLTDPDNAQIVLFTMCMGGMIGVMSGSGGTQALVLRLTAFVQRRRQGQVMTWLLGMVIFFDDYANTLLIGSTMRSIADRLRISREKLAFLVDSTAAPVAGLALVSTWVGVEIGYMQAAYAGVGLSTGEIYQTFLLTIPYRFYPILLLIFVGQIAWSCRDYGPMLTAERAAQSRPERSEQREEAPEKTATHARLAVIPLVTLCVVLGLAMWVDPEASSRALLLGSAAALFVGIVGAVGTRTISLTKAVGESIGGMKQMLPAIVVLLLAWSVSTICNAQHLNTAGFLVELLGDRLAPEWMPLVTFLLAAVVSFATGTSYGTMGLLMPLCVALQFPLLLDQEIPLSTIAQHPLMLATVGAVLGGAIFGDHCSPISDTTILSSAATGCEHLAHVRTQIPYALTVGLVACGGAYVPLAYGVSPLWSLLLLPAVLWGILRFLGKPVAEHLPDGSSQ